jgi:hypothetical protein
MMTIGRCPHGLNPVACLKCFHAPKAAAPQQQRPMPTAPGGIPGAQLPKRHDRVMVAPAVVDGANIGVPGSGIPPVSEEERAKYRKEPKAVPGANAAPPQAPPVPFSYNQYTGAEHDPSKVWEPPKRAELIDRLPQHPEAGKMR